MATLVGKDTFAVNYNSRSGGEYRLYYLGYTATAGSATEMRMRIRDGIASACRMALYDAAGNLVAETASIAISPSGTPQTVVGAITATLTVQTYYLAAQFNGSCEVDTTTDVFVLAGDAITYGAYPSTITVPPSNDFGTGIPAIWVDGTAGGGSSPVLAAGQYDNRLSNFTHLRM